MTKRQDIVIATNNRGKLREFNQLLPKERFRIHMLSQYTSLQADENSSTFIGNALLKAHHASQYTDFAILADDSGLCVEHLKGRPGINSARYSLNDKNYDSSNTTDANNNLKLLATLAGQTNRRAYYYCALVLLSHRDDPTPVIATAKWHGTIATSPKGCGGFGYDSIFIDEQQQSVADLNDYEKNQKSHRAKAVAKLLQQLS